MWALLDALCWSRALGVYLAEGHLTLTEVATTLAGTKVRATARLPVEGSSPGKVLGEWLGSHLTARQRRHLPVQIGLAPEQTFFTTRRVAETQAEVPTVESLLASGANSSLDLEGTVAGYVRSKLGGATMYSIAACRRKLAEEIGQTLAGAGVSDARLGPAPCWVLDMANRDAKAPRGWKVFMRVLLSDKGGLAVLVANGRPMLWRRFALAEGQEALSIASAVRHVEIHAVNNLGIKGTSGVLVQGRIDSSMAEKLLVEAGAEAVVVPGPALDEASYSLAMALAAQKQEPDQIDLLASIRPAPTMGQMFPRRLAALMVLVAASAGGVLWNTLAELESEAAVLGRQTALHAWAKSSRTDKISGERKLLAAEVSAVQQFLGSRVIWSDYLRDLPTRLPPNACLQGLEGEFEMKSGSSKNARQRVNRKLMIRGLARFADRGQAPKEIDSFLDSLRGVECLKRDFPLVNLAEIRWRKDADGSVAVFTIVAMPKAGPAEEGEEKEEEKK